MAGSGPAPPAPADPDAYQELSGRQDSRDRDRRQHRGGGRADGDPLAGRRVLLLGQELLAARAVVDVPLAFALVAFWGFWSSWTPRRFPGGVHVETCEKS